MTFAPAQIVEKALAGLTYAWRDGDRHFVSVPVQYPSGALCTVEISTGKNHAHLSDMGAGFAEADMLCEETSFPRFAQQQAAKRGLKFDGHTIHIEDVAEGMLVAAVIAVANASAAAAHAAIANDGERREEMRKNIIFQKVRLAFPDANVSRVLDVAGVRATWTAHNVVHLRNDRLAIFEPVTGHQNSISSKFLMFSDLLQRGSLSLNAVFSDPRKLSPKAQMLKEVANVVGVEDSIEVYRLKVA
jgi:hypothetical protein